MTIKEIRNITGLSQNKFSEKYGIPPRTIQDWEAGRRVPPEYVVKLLARCVMMDMEERKVYTADRETGTFIDEVSTIEEGFKKITEYEQADRNDGSYEPDFYDIVDRDHCTLIR